MTNLNSNDSQKIKGALMVVCEVTDVCTHNYASSTLDGNKKKAFNSVFMHFEPAVRNLLTNLAMMYADDNKRDFNDTTHIQCAEIIELCCNFMKISCKVEIPAYFTESGNDQYLAIWLNIYKALVAKQLYEKEAMSNTELIALNDPWWNIKISIVETLRNLLI